MARGWESKSVEDQQSLAEERRAFKATTISEAERARQHEIASLELSRTRVLHDLETTTHERYRQSLEAALAHLDGKIAAAKGPSNGQG